MVANPPKSADTANEYEDAVAAWLSPGAAAAKTVAPDDDPFAKKNDTALAEALARVREFVRRRFTLPEDAAILVSEIACPLPGCPPRETVVAFWTTDAGSDKRHHFKLFKDADAIAYDDLPYAWLKDTLVVPEGFACECC